jgi:RNA polymerase sigma-70 factor (ECF subfamily)
VSPIRRGSDFDELFDRMFPLTVQLAGRLVGSADAEDVAEEAFARALERWEHVGRLPHVDAWVLRVATNVALDRLRRDRRRPTLVVAESIAPDEATALKLTVREALKRLPRRQSEVVALRFLVGLTESEVAGALGISLGSVKTHTRRGVGALRRRLGEHEEELFDVS